ncbi:hypothetical protein [Streptomyces sp. NPDC002172]
MQDHGHDGAPRRSRGRCARPPPDQRPRTAPAVEPGRKRLPGRFAAADAEHAIAHGRHAIALTHADEVAQVEET